MKRSTIYAIIAFILFATLFVVEQLRSAEPFDLINFFLDLAETTMLAGAILLSATFLSEVREIKNERTELQRDLRKVRQDSELWRKQAKAHVQGLSKAISDQFNAWSLTSAETDVASLMLKGLSHKEIASLRDSSEATVRQHATVVYRKSGLDSRTQLSAFFFEDLLDPIDTDGSRYPSPISSISS